MKTVAFARVQPAAMLVATMLLATMLLGTAAAADIQPPEVPYENFDYNGRFTFARIKFTPTLWGPGPFLWGLDLKWNHDYPYAEQNLMKILDELTLMGPTMGGGNILAADDPRLFEHPLAYLCEVGYWEPTDKEAESLRQYLLKGGFLIIDDFSDERMHGFQFRNFERQIDKVLPGVRLIELTETHRIFRDFFYVEDLDFTHPVLPYLETKFYGIFEDNDPAKRLMVIVNYNNDIGDYWEWSDQADSWYPIDLTKRGFQLGVNYILYGLAH